MLLAQGHPALPVLAAMVRRVGSSLKIMIIVAHHARATTYPRMREASFSQSKEHIDQEGKSAKEEEPSWAFKSQHPRCYRRSDTNSQISHSAS